MNHETESIHWLDAIGLLKFSGQRVGNFLQSQFTCDVKVVMEDKPRFGAYCNRQGRVLAAFDLFLKGEDFYACLPYDVLPSFKEAMQAYARLARVTLTDASDQLDLKRTFLSLNRPLPASMNDWRLQAIQQGIGYIYKETIGLFTPHQLEYPALGAVSFTKGCYLGQEIIARMEHRGKRKYARYQATLEEGQGGPVKPGDAVVNQQGDTVGTIVDAVPVDQRYVVLASLLIQAAEAFPEIAQKWLVLSCAE